MPTNFSVRPSKRARLNGNVALTKLHEPPHINPQFSCAAAEYRLIFHWHMSEKAQQQTATTGPPAWLFSNNSANPSSVKTPVENTDTMAKKEKKSSKKEVVPVVASRVTTSTTKSIPPSQLMDLVETFLSDQGFDKAHREFKKHRADKGWKAQDGKKKQKKTHHSLVSVFQTWETFSSKDGTPTVTTSKEEVTTVSSSSDDDSSSDESSDSDSDAREDIDMKDAPVSAPANVDTSSSSSSSSSSSDSESDSEDEVAAAPTAAAASNPLKRKAKPDDSDSSDSDSDDDTSDSSSSSSEDDKARQPKKKVKTADSSSESESSSSESDSSDDEVDTKGAAVAASSSSDSDSSSSSSESDSDSESESETEVAAQVPLPDSDSSSSSSESDSEDDKAKKISKRKPTNGTGSDTSATLEKTSPEVIPVPMFAPLPPDPVLSSNQNNRGKNGAKGGRTPNEPFSRIKKDVKIDERLSSNAYVEHGYGQKAYEDLVVTKGKGFTKEKNKKKRGAYKGGPLDVNVSRSIKFDD